MTGINRQEIEKSLSYFEGMFNIASYTVGLVSSYPGQYRMMYGSLEIVTGIALCGIEAFKACFTGDAHSSEQRLERAFEHIAYSGHGVLNFARGYGEAYFPLFSLIGLVWDVSGMRFKYSAESGPEGTVLTRDMIMRNAQWLRRIADGALRGGSTRET